MSTEEELKHELVRARAELRMLYEISSAMRSTFDLYEILYMILTAITCKEGLGFNRAMLFLVSDDERSIDGVMAIGPRSAEEAGRIWSEMEERDVGLDDLIYSYHAWEEKGEKSLHEAVRKISMPLRDDSGIIAQTCLEGMPFEITTSEKRKKVKDPVLDELKCDLFVSVPMPTRAKILGTILADNVFTGHEITRDDIRMLTMFANQAGRAIDNSRLYEETLRMAKTDSLSHLWNHATFQEQAKEAVKDAKQNKEVVSLLMIDIDYFKYYNDNAGHPAGDEVIRQVADVLRTHTRQEDTAARYGGEEFAIVLPRTDKKTAFEAAERIRLGIEERDFPKEKQQPEGGLTVSIGVATYPYDAASKDSLLRRADMALYEAKQDGRNRCRAAKPRKKRKKT